MNLNLVKDCRMIGMVTDGSICFSTKCWWRNWTILIPLDPHIVMDFCWIRVFKTLYVSISLEVITERERETKSHYTAGFRPKTDHIQFFTNLHEWDVPLRVAFKKLTFIRAFLSWLCLITQLFLQLLHFKLHPGKFGVHFISEFLQGLFYAL